MVGPLARIAVTSVDHLLFLEEAENFPVPVTTTARSIAPVPRPAEPDPLARFAGAVSHHVVLFQRIALLVGNLFNDSALGGSTKHNACLNASATLCRTLTPLGRVPHDVARRTVGTVSQEIRLPVVSAQLVGKQIASLIGAVHQTRLAQ